ncbi:MULTISPECIES: hypothetical protein [unclassified Erythrobacter]|uniref:hypothetical protein n=1 Tax=unclassified Erythrobacter TaxID=2633097 RepID=UPI0008306533|nr:MULTISPECIES: hypothetical protein [unclassified Erythrobacter]MBO6768457.1 hypothetical protein [Erythrobacter sp.]
MRRALVLTSEAHRHWFRASLPQRRSGFADLPAGGMTDWRLTADDVRGAATTYFATVAAVLAFII